MAMVTLHMTCILNFVHHAFYGRIFASSDFDELIGRSLLLVAVLREVHWRADYNNATFSRVLLNFQGPHLPFPFETHKAGLYSNDVIYVTISC